MKRALTIIALTFSVCVCSSSQISHVGGDLRYEHEYEDMLFNDHLSTVSRSNPMLSLTLGGVVVSDRIADFNLTTSLSINYGSGHANAVTLGNRQSYWNAYDAKAFFFRFSPIKLELGARDHIIENKTDYNGVSGNTGETRSQQQRAKLSFDRIPFLPSITIEYTQERSWSLSSIPLEQTNRQWAFSVGASATPGSALNFSGNITDAHERYSNLSDQTTYLQFTGMRELAPGHRIDIHSEYFRFGSSGSITGSATYNGGLSETVRLGTNLTGSESSNPFTTYRTVGSTQTLNLSLSDALRMGVSVNGNAGKYTFTDESRSSYNGAWGTGFTLQHLRRFGGVVAVNNLTLGYTMRDFGEMSRLLQGAIANNISTNVGQFALTGNYSLTALSNQNRISWYTIINSANVAANGMLPGMIRTNSSIQGRWEGIHGDIRTVGNRQIINISQGFEKRVTWYIPLNLALNGGVNWYTFTISTRTYSWRLSLASPSFFLQALFMTYSYSRSYDPYYRRELIEQQASFDYRWRALVFNLRFRQASVPYRLRDVNLVVSRAF